MGKRRRKSGEQASAARATDESNVPPKQVGYVPIQSGGASTKSSDDPPPPKKKRPRRRRRKKATPVEEQPANEVDTPKPKKRPTRKKSPSVKGSTPVDKVSTDEATPEKSGPKPKQKPKPKPKPKRKKSKTAAKKAAEKPVKKTADFVSLGLSDLMMESLAESKYLEPTPIQAGLIPLALKDLDVMGQARTGTGKTAAFGIPILERLDLGKGHRNPQALILTPTRELAVQVRDEISKLSFGRKVSVVPIYGGKPIRRQTEQLRRGAHIVVGTPGRLIDHMNRGTLVLNDIKCVVLDEADRMLDIGFRPDIEKILRRCPQSRQTLLLSATIPPPVDRLARRYMRDPEKLDFSPEDISVDTIEQYYFTVDPTRKFSLLVRLLQHEKPHQAIIFCRTKRGTDKLHQKLSRKVDSAATIHGDLPQTTRDSVMSGFRSGKIRYLVATDVVGRGIDVTSISHIINFDIPQFCDDYIHRVGRAGRMGREGVAFTFVTPEEGNELTRIEMRINRLLKRGEIEDIETADRPKATETAEESAKATESAEQAPPESKPVFGRPRRRIRRAL